MALNRWRVNFSGSERVDLPDFRLMLTRAYADFELLIQSYFDNEAKPRVLRRYQQGTHTANTFKIVKDFNRAVTDNNQRWLYANIDSGQNFNLSVLSGQTNYISVRISETLDDLQTRAFWDTDVGLTGEEFFDEINVRYRLDEQFQVNQSGFPAPSSGWVPLFTVVVDGSGNITSVTRADDLLWKPRSFSLPSAATRANVYESSVQDLRTFLDFLGAIVGETKETSGLIESAPWSNIKLLREYQNMFISGGGSIEWEGGQGSNTLGWSAALRIDIAGRTNPYTVAAGQITLSEGEVAYLEIPEDQIGGVLTFSKSLISDVPVVPTDAGFSPRIFCVFFRRGGKIYGAMDIPELDSGESGEIGQNLSANIRARLGIVSDTSYEAYTSLNNIALGDSYPVAISKLDAVIAGITGDLPKEESFTVVNPLGQTNFTAAVLEWDASNAIPDLQVYVNGQRAYQAPDGNAANGDYIKISTTEIQFSYTLPKDAFVLIRDERTGGAGGGGGSDLTNITVNPSPTLNGGQSLGIVTKAWSGLFLKDTASSQVYRIDITSGVLNITAVP